MKLLSIYGKGYSLCANSEFANLTVKNNDNGFCLSCTENHSSEYGG